MKKVFLFFVLFLFPAAYLNADWQAGVTVTDDGIKSFYVAVGEYYGLPEKDVTAVKKEKIKDEEVPVVFFIARNADVNVSVIIGLREKGMGWLDISLKYGIGPEVFYMPVEKEAGPPYGRAYGYFKNKPKGEWKTIKLSDSEITDFVNLRFIAEHYGYPPEDVMRMRGERKNFITINSEIMKEKKAGKGKPSKGKGRKPFGR